MLILNIISIESIVQYIYDMIIFLGLNKQTNKQKKKRKNMKILKISISEILD